MKNTPNIDPNKSSSIGHKVEFWAGVVVGYEHQEEQLASGIGWRYKVRIIGDHSDVDQVDEKDLSYADVLLSTDAGSGASYKLRSVRINQGDTVYGIKGPNIPTMIIGVEPRKRTTVLHSDGKFKTLSGFYGSLVKNNILSGEFNEQLGPATPGGVPYKIDKSNRPNPTEKLKELGIDPKEDGFIENIEEKISPILKDVVTEFERLWEPGQHLSKELLFEIKEKTEQKVLEATTYLAAVQQALVQNLIETETFKKLKAEALTLANEQKLIVNNTYTVAGVQYEVASGLPTNQGTFDENMNYIPPGFEDAIRTDEIETDEGTFDENMNYIPPGFEDATTIDYNNLA